MNFTPIVRKPVRSLLVCLVLISACDDGRFDPDGLDCDDQFADTEEYADVGEGAEDDLDNMDDLDDMDDMDDTNDPWSDSLEACIPERLHDVAIDDPDGSGAP